MPILIRTNAQAYMVSPGGFSNEEELEFLLVDSPALLGGDDNEVPDILLVDRQIRLPDAGTLDLLFVDSKGLPIAVEVKLARNGESRRLVVAQAIDYLSSLTALTVDELDALVTGKLKAALNKFVYEDESESSFDLVWKAVGTNLRAGQARLVVVLDDPRPDLERIFHFLARNSKLDVQLFTVQHYSSPSGDKVFVPRILVNPATEDDGSRAPSPHKSLEELLAGCTNQAVRDFFRERLSHPRNSNNDALVYEVSGTKRWYVGVSMKNNCARVTQIGRFQNDEERWKEKLSAPEFSYQKGQKNNLLFSLNTPEDFTYFQDTMNQPASSFLWQKKQAASAMMPSLGV